jgi:hypothetical protein
VKPGGLMIRFERLGQRSTLVIMNRRGKANVIELAFVRSKTRFFSPARLRMGRGITAQFTERLLAASAPPLEILRTTSTR